MTQVKCSQIREKTLDELENDLNKLQILKIQGKNSNKIKKSIVNIHIVKNQTIKDNLRKFYNEKQYKPKDLRTKQTRAMRRLLTSEEKSIELKKIQRNNSAFPKRTFALKE